MSSGQQTTNINDLTNALKKKAPQIRQKIQVAKSTKKLLQKPLDKVHADKVIFIVFSICLIAYLFTLSKKPRHSCFFFFLRNPNICADLDACVFIVYNVYKSTLTKNIYNSHITMFWTIILSIYLLYF